MKTLVHWFKQHDHGGFPVELAALGSCDLSVIHIGREWQWLVRQGGRDVVEGAATAADEAKGQAEEAALRFDNHAL